MLRVLTLLTCAFCLLAMTGPATAQETLRIKGSDTIGGKLTPELAETFRARGGKLGFVVEALGSATAFVGLFDGSADIGESSRPINEAELRTATQLGLKLREVVIGYDGVAVIVNPANPVASLSIAQLSDLFTGKVQSWKRLGGRDVAVRLIGRPAYSGTHSFFRDRVVRRGNSKGPEQFADSITVLEENGAILRAVAAEPGAVAYVGLGWLDPTVKALRIRDTERGEGVQPGVETVRSGKYPLYRSLLMYLPTPPRPSAAEFLKFVLSADGAAIVTRNGFVAPDVPGEPVVFPAASAAAPAPSATAGQGRPKQVAEAPTPSLATAPSQPSAEALTSQPAAPPKPAPGAESRELLRVFLPPSAVTPGPEAAAVLERAATLARTRGVRVVITGHADATGPTGANARVSRARAEAVAEALRRLGVPADRVVVMASSSESPLASNASAAGRSRNRRVDIEVVER